ncbi:hypothetical protein B0H19DRAFT_1154168 [Mycena capillaripes]|nr:hypothetical protein B0H19DRAFT_1154168 [Mycena capillaripes]
MDVSFTTANTNLATVRSFCGVALLALILIVSKSELAMISWSTINSIVAVHTTLGFFPRY